MATIFIENKAYAVKDGQNLLHACLSLGFDIPYFCWHPAMHSVGSCRQCAVKQFKDEKDTKGKIVMSCMTPAEDGTRISIDDPEAKSFRADIIELLMTNHPHDCPVCDEGGECHLQDMTVMTGHAYREYRFKKRTYRNQDLGPFVNHEMNRCIQCYRCVRFYRDYAGGKDLGVFASHHHVYFGRQRNGFLKSPFSGNLVEVCPTGVFTDKTLKRHYTRKWDLQTAPSVCVHCSLGCNTIPGERYGTLRRIRNRYNCEVNGYFLCDRGRYGYEFVNSARRIRRPQIRFGESRSRKGQVVRPETVLDHLSSILYFGAKVIGIGSPRASLESNFMLRSLVGEENFFSGMSSEENSMVTLMINVMKNGPARSPSLKEVASADAVFVLGEDVVNTAPMLELALRQSVRQQPMEKVKGLGIPLWNDAGVREAIQDEKGPLFLALPAGSPLDDIASETFHGAPGDLARIGFAVAHKLKREAPDPPDLSHKENLFARAVAQALKEAKRPLVISGAGCADEEVIQAAANVAWALCRREQASYLCLVPSECNSVGLGLLGGREIGAAFRAVKKGKADTVIVIENDLYRRADNALVDNLFLHASKVIAIDHLENRTTEKADVTLPAATFAESDGTIINNEGRAQRFYQVFMPEGDVRESWQWLRDIMTATGQIRATGWRSIDDVVSKMTASLPYFSGIGEIAPPHRFRMKGQKIPRQPHRYSGRTSMHANVSVHEPELPQDEDSPLSFSMEGYDGQPPSALIPRFWSPGWNSVQAVNKYQDETGGHLRGGDPGVRLVHPKETEDIPYFTKIPGAFQPSPDKWLLIPLHHIYGSEELSILSPGIAELAPSAYIGIRDDDASSLGMEEGMEVILGVHKESYLLPVRLMPELPPGVAGLPGGLREFAGLGLPLWGTLSKAGHEQG
jgi:NADH-quinone oxidoreductase subunit G